MLLGRDFTRARSAKKIATSKQFVIGRGVYGNRCCGELIANYVWLIAGLNVWQEKINKSWVALELVEIVFNITLWMLKTWTSLSAVQTKSDLTMILITFNELFGVSDEIHAISVPNCLLMDAEWEYVEFKPVMIGYVNVFVSEIYCNENVWYNYNSELLSHFNGWKCAFILQILNQTNPHT